MENCFCLWGLVISQFLVTVWRDVKTEILGESSASLNQCNSSQLKRVDDLFSSSRVHLLLPSHSLLYTYNSTGFTYDIHSVELLRNFPKPFFKNQDILFCWNCDFYEKHMSFTIIWKILIYFHFQPYSWANSISAKAEETSLVCYLSWSSAANYLPCPGTRRFHNTKPKNVLFLLWWMCLFLAKLATLYLFVYLVLLVNHKLGCTATSVAMSVFGHSWSWLLSETPNHVSQSHVQGKNSDEKCRPRKKEQSCYHYSLGGLILNPPSSWRISPKHILVFVGQKVLILTKVIRKFEKNISLVVYHMKRLYLSRIFFSLAF